MMSVARTVMSLLSLGGGGTDDVDMDINVDDGNSPAAAPVALLFPSSAPPPMLYPNEVSSGVRLNTFPTRCRRDDGPPPTVPRPPPPGNPLRNGLDNIRDGGVGAMNFLVGGVDAIVVKVAELVVEVFVGRCCCDVTATDEETAIVLSLSSSSSSGLLMPRGEGALRLYLYLGDGGSAIELLVGATVTPLLPTRRGGMVDVDVDINVDVDTDVEL